MKELLNIATNGLPYWHQSKEYNNFIACSVNFSLLQEIAGMRLCRFPAQEKERKEAGKHVGKKQWIEYLRQPFLSFFLL